MQWGWAARELALSIRAGWGPRGCPAASFWGSQRSCCLVSHPHWHQLEPVAWRKASPPHPCSCIFSCRLRARLPRPRARAVHGSQTPPQPAQGAGLCSSLPLTLSRRSRDCWKAERAEPPLITPLAAEEPHHPLFLAAGGDPQGRGAVLSPARPARPTAPAPTSARASACVCCCSSFPAALPLCFPTLLPWLPHKNAFLQPTDFGVRRSRGPHSVCAAPAGGRRCSALL